MLFHAGVANVGTLDQTTGVLQCLIQQGLARQDRDLSLTRDRARWGATVFVTGMEHSIGQGSG